MKEICKLAYKHVYLFVKSEQGHRKYNELRGAISVHFVQVLKSWREVNDFDKNLFEKHH